MATTKKAVKFYADPAIEAHLESIPAQLRSNWINQALKAAIAEHQTQQTSELSQLRDWLRKAEGPPLYEAMADMLDEFANRS